MLMLSIRAPRRPPCATSRVVLLYRSMKGTMPVDVNALFFTGLPAGRMCVRSCPTPPRRFISCTCSWSIFIMPPYESLAPLLPITKQLDSDTTWKSLPMPDMGLPCGMT